MGSHGGEAWASWPNGTSLPGLGAGAAGPAWLQGVDAAPHTESAHSGRLGPRTAVRTGPVGAVMTEHPSWACPCLAPAAHCPEIAHVTPRKFVLIIDPNDYYFHT